MHIAPGRNVPNTGLPAVPSTIDVPFQIYTRPGSATP
jgi:hypothetical protein